jgi:hypothetical protein
MSNCHGGGRILPHQQDADSNVVILGLNIAVSAKHTASVKATEPQDLNVKNKRNYRNRIKHIYEPLAYGSWMLPFLLALSLQKL